jgi:hypothetical protein
MILDFQITIARVFGYYGYNSGEKLEGLGWELARTGVGIRTARDTERTES